MTAAAGKCGGKGIGGGEQGSGLGGHGSDFHAGPAVEAEDGADLWTEPAIEHAGIDQAARPPAAFLRRLPDELDADGEIGRDGLENCRDAHDRGGMAIMPAGVHVSVVRAGVW